MRGRRPRFVVTRDETGADGSNSPDPGGRARAYYRALDEDDYDLLRSILDQSFVHERPDMTLSGRDRFVRFMREERPVTDTAHAVDEMYRRDADDGTDDGVAVRGRLLGPDGAELTGFVDVFSFEGASIDRVRTYVDSV